jgi:hypothetical protein
MKHWHIHLNVGRDAMSYHSNDWQNVIGLLNELDSSTLNRVTVQQPVMPVVHDHTDTEGIKWIDLDAQEKANETK